MEQKTSNDMKCKNCGREKEYPNYDYCLECYKLIKTNRGWKICKKCGKLFHPYENDHKYCNNCFYKNQLK